MKAGRIARYDGLRIMKIDGAVRASRMGPAESGESPLEHLSGSVELYGEGNRISLAISGGRLPLDLHAGKLYRITIKAYRPKKASPA